VRRSLVERAFPAAVATAARLQADAASQQERKRARATKQAAAAVRFKHPVENPFHMLRTLLKSLMHF
jgi:hypothetical protein